MTGHRIELKLELHEDPVDEIIDWCQQSIGHYRDHKWAMQYGPYDHNIQTVTFTFEEEAAMTMFTLRWLTKR